MRVPALQSLRFVILNTVRTLYSNEHSSKLTYPDSERCENPRCEFLRSKVPYSYTFIFSKPYENPKREFSQNKVDVSLS